MADGSVSSDGTLLYHPVPLLSGLAGQCVVEGNCREPCSGKAYPGEKGTVRVGLYSPCGHCGDGKYCRGGHSRDHGRTGSCVLDVGLGAAWDDDSLCGSLSGKKIPLSGLRPPSNLRSLCLSGTGAWHEGTRLSLRSALHSVISGNGKHGTGQLCCRECRFFSRNPSDCDRFCPDGSGNGSDIRGSQAHLPGGGGACSVFGSILYGVMRSCDSGESSRNSVCVCRDFPGCLLCGQRGRRDGWNFCEQSSQIRDFQRGVFQRGGAWEPGCTPWGGRRGGSGAQPGALCL